MTSSATCFNSRTPGGVRHKLREWCTPIDVSIHAPREGCDISCVESTPLLASFQFTHPGRGATTLVA